MVKNEYLEIGRIVSTHGIKGEVRVQPWCDSPDELTRFETLYIKDTAGRRAVGILSARVHKNVVVMKLDGVDTVEQAQKLRDKILLAARADFGLPEGRYFVADLLSMEIVDCRSGEIYGRLTDVLQYGAADVYEVTGQGGSKLLIPAIDGVIEKRDFDSGKIYVDLPEGLVEATSDRR